jgi:hypothetical protein
MIFGPFDNCLNLLGSKWLGQIIKPLLGFDGMSGGVAGEIITSYKEMPLYFGKNLHTVNIRQADVGEHQMERVFCHPLQGFFTFVKGLYLQRLFLKKLFQPFTDDFFIINNRQTQN